MRRGWLRRNRLTTTLPHMIRLCGRVWLPAAAPRCFYFQRYTAPQPSCPARTASPISLVKSLSGGLGLKTRRPPGRLCRALRIPVSIRSSAVGIPLVPTQGEYPIPLARSVAVRRPVRPKRNPRNRPENSLTSSGENSVTRYTNRADVPFDFKATVKRNEGQKDFMRPQSRGTGTEIRSLGDIYLPIPRCDHSS